jgi:hypothetical protein
MTIETNIDIDAAHRFFAPDCFNRTWSLIDKPERTPEEDEAMLLLSMASLWHWTQRPDCTEQNLSIGYWQVSRVYALLRQVENARRYAQRCLESSQGEEVPLFCLGYAYEALARAESIAGERARMKAYLSLAYQTAERMTDMEAHEMLLADLETIQ